MWTVPDGGTAVSYTHLTLGPIIEEIAEERTDIKVCKIDVDENPEIARQYKVFSIPMLFVFKNGEVAARTVGAQSKEAILEML